MSLSPSLIVNEIAAEPRICPVSVKKALTSSQMAIGSRKLTATIWEIVASTSSWVYKFSSNSSPRFALLLLIRSISLSCMRAESPNNRRAKSLVAEVQKICPLKPF